MGDRQQGNGNGEATANGRGSGAGERGLEAELADVFAVGGDDLGSLLMGQLDDLIGSWAKVIEVVAQHGVDPTPLLQTLAHTLRATADQLDPDGHPAPEGP